MVVQWLRLRTSTARARVQSMIRQALHAMQCDQKKKKLTVTLKMIISTTFLGRQNLFHKF